MDVTEIPFVEKFGISRAEGGGLELPFTASLQNHLQTLAASAQFTLAETASGDALQQLFPELAGKVVPVLRDSTIKFKQPAKTTVNAFAFVAEETVSRFKAQYARKGRSSISVDVEVKDAEGVVTCVGTFNWFVQSIREA